MPRNAMTAPNRAGQNRWLAGWQQRQKQNNPGYNASWMPKTGWRGRFNQSQQQPAWKTEPKAPVPGSYSHTGPREPWDPNPRPDGTYGPPVPPAPPTPWTPGWRTLAPVGVAADGWRGGAIEHTPGHLISGPTAKEVRETGVPGQYGGD